MQQVENCNPNANGAHSEREGSEHQKYKHMTIDDQSVPLQPHQDHLDPETSQTMSPNRPSFMGSKEKHVASRSSSVLKKRPNSEIRAVNSFLPLSVKISRKNSKSPETAEVQASYNVSKNGPTPDNMMTIQSVSGSELFHQPSTSKRSQSKR